MRALITFFLIITVGTVLAQKPCYQHSRLYIFHKGDEPKLFTDPLGRHPQFPFLQRMNGITTPEAFLKSINDPAQQRKYNRTFPAFDLLLKNSGFPRGYKDLSLKNIRKVYITPGTVGNLGFFNRETNVLNYDYVILNPANEAPEGVEAWKLINKDGCYLYILFTCGNAFYPNADVPVGGAGGAGVGGVVPAGGKNNNCCRVVTVQPVTPSMRQTKDSVERKVNVSINHYKAWLTPSERKGHVWDTAVSLIKHKDTTVHFKDRLIIPAKPDSAFKSYSLCRDSTLRVPNAADSARQTDTTQPLHYVLADTVYEKKEPEEQPECDNKWEVSIEGGKSFNSVPRLDDPVAHTQTNGSQMTATVEVSRIITHWFQLGISAAYVVLSYQDDVNYPGWVPGTYNTVYLAKPIIPIQLFGKFNFGKPIGWQTSVNLSFGYSIPTNGKITNGTTTLTTTPNLKGDFTAGLKFGIAYYFNCHVGVSASFMGEYFNNKSDLIAYSLWALPVQAGLHFRF